MRALRAVLVSVPLTLLVSVVSFVFPVAAGSAVPAAAAAPGAAAAETYKQATGPLLVTMTLEDWTDAARKRPVPVKIYAPATGKGPFPVIVFSHGLGGSREGYKYLGRHWASYGYVAVHVEHLGSDTAAFKEGFKGGRPGRLLASMRESIADPQNAVARPLDVRFVLDRLEKLNQGGSPLAHRLDLSRVGMAGHSFGAWTTLVVAGQRIGREVASGSAPTYADPRVKAAIAMSAPVPRKREDLESAFAPIHIPILHMTGTLDDSPLGETSAAERRIPYDHIHGADQYLVTFTGGDHMIFSGHLMERSERGAKDARFQDLILQGTTAFWDAYLKGDAGAKSWLARGYGAVLGKDGRIEEKLVGK
jgi:predicted dienelactone hydrolase